MNKKLHHKDTTLYAQSHYIITEKSYIIHTYPNFLLLLY